jgi:hypothetical protein
VRHRAKWFQNLDKLRLGKRGVGSNTPADDHKDRLSGTQLGRGCRGRDACDRRSWLCQGSAQQHTAPRLLLLVQPQQDLGVPAVGWLGTRMQLKCDCHFHGQPLGACQEAAHLAGAARKWKRGKMMSEHRQPRAPNASRSANLATIKPLEHHSTHMQPRGLAGRPPKRRCAHLSGCCIAALTKRTNLSNC